MESLVNNSTKILEEIVPPVVRRVMMIDYSSARFIEGIFKFFVLFADQILQRMNDKFKKEFALKQIKSANELAQALALTRQLQVSSSSRRHDRSIGQQTPFPRKKSPSLGIR